MSYTQKNEFTISTLLTRSETGTVLFFRFTDGDRKILRICMFGRSMTLHPIPSNTVSSTC